MHARPVLSQWGVSPVLFNFFWEKEKELVTRSSESQSRMQHSNDYWMDEQTWTNTWNKSIKRQMKAAPVKGLWCAGVQETSRSILTSFWCLGAARGIKIVSKRIKEEKVTISFLSEYWVLKAKLQALYNHIRLIPAMLSNMKPLKWRKQCFKSTQVTSAF